MIFKYSEQSKRSVGTAIKIGKVKSLYDDSWILCGTSRKFDNSRSKYDDEYPGVHI